MKSTTDTICRGALATLALCLLCASCQYEAAVDALDEKLEGIASSEIWSRSSIFRSR